MRVAFFRSCIVGAAVVAWTAACGGSSSTSPATDGGSVDAASTGPHACSPLEGKSTPTMLAGVLGAGRHADGTVYVLDNGGTGGYRAFVSEGSALERKVVSGSGTTGGANGTISITATVSDAKAPFALQIEQKDGVAQRMGVFRGELQTKSFEIGVQGDVLELIGNDVLSHFPVHNLPGDVVVEYDATTQDGHRVFITRPAVDWGYQDFRVFYGTADRMLERRLVTAARGSTTFITFDLDGVQTTAIFPSAFSPVQDTARLATETQSQPLTVLAADAGTAGAGLAFFCL